MRASGRADGCGSAGAFLALSRQEEDLGDGAGAAGDGVSGIGSGVEVKQPAEYGAGAGVGVLGQGQGLDLGEQGAVSVVGDHEGSRLSLSYVGGMRGRRVLAVEQALVSALTQLPQGHAHDHGGHEQDDEDDGLITGDH